MLFRHDARDSARARSELNCVLRHNRKPVLNWPFLINDNHAAKQEKNFGPLALRISERHFPRERTTSFGNSWLRTQ